MDIQILIGIIFTLFLIVDPVAAVPLLPEMMKSNTKKEKTAMVRRAIIVSFLVLAFFAIAGRFLLGYFGVGQGAVRIAGGILLFGIGVEMLYGRVSRTESSKKEHEEAIEKKDVSITPLAIPLLAGPGAIATVMMYSGMHEGWPGLSMILIAIVLVILVSWILLGMAEKLGEKLGGIGVKVVARVMGLLLIFSATQIFLNGMKIAGIIAA